MAAVSKFQTTMTLRMRFRLAKGGTLSSAVAIYILLLISCLSEVVGAHHDLQKLCPVPKRNESSSFSHRLKESSDMALDTSSGLRNVTTELDHIASKLEELQSMAEKVAKCAEECESYFRLVNTLDKPVDVLSKVPKVGLVVKPLQAPLHALAKQSSNLQGPLFQLNKRLNGRPEGLVSKTQRSIFAINRSVRASKRSHKTLRDVSDLCLRLRSLAEIIPEEAVKRDFGRMEEILPSQKQAIEETFLAVEDAELFVNYVLQYREAVDRLYDNLVSSMSALQSVEYYINTYYKGGRLEAFLDRSSSYLDWLMTPIENYTDRILRPLKDIVDAMMEQLDPLEPFQNQVNELNELLSAEVVAKFDGVVERLTDTDTYIVLGQVIYAISINLSNLLASVKRPAEITQGAIVIAIVSLLVLECASFFADVSFQNHSLRNILKGYSLRVPNMFKTLLHVLCQGMASRMPLASQRLLWGNANIAKIPPKFWVLLPYFVMALDLWKRQSKVVMAHVIGILLGQLFFVHRYVLFGRSARFAMKDSLINDDCLKDDISPESKSATIGFAAKKAVKIIPSFKMRT